MTSFADAGLPALSNALSPEGIHLVSGVLSDQLRQVIPPSGRVALIKHVAGKRATLLYSFAGDGARLQFIGKLYRSHRRAARMHRWLLALNRDVYPINGSARVPQPVGSSEELRMVLLEYIDGQDLRHALSINEPFVLAAHWLARLHEAAPLDELKERTVAHEVEKSAHWLDSVQHHAAPELQSRLDSARDRLATVMSSPPAAELTTVHRDFYYANLLWDGERIWTIDLDQLRLGDPALDVAHFMAHLQVLAYRQTGTFESYDSQAHCFLAAYHAERPGSQIEPRLPLYAAYTYLKLAATEADRARPGWRIEFGALAARACDELERLS